MTEFEKVLMNRDGMTAEEARDERQRMREEIWDMAGDDASYSDIEDLLLDECGLEMDYLLDLI